MEVRWAVSDASQYPNYPEVETTLRPFELQLAVALDHDYVFTMPSA